LNHEIATALANGACAFEWADGQPVI